MNPWGKLRRCLFGVQEREVTFSRRGFQSNDDSVRQRLEKVALAFLFGYHHGLEVDDEDDLAVRLQEADRDFQGYAYEGAAMAMALRDMVTPGPSRRFDRFIEGPAEPHIYMAHIGYALDDRSRFRNRSHRRI